MTNKHKYQKTKYYKPNSTGSGRATIPISIARSLGWEDKDELIAKITHEKGKVGLFLYKSKE